MMKIDRISMETWQKVINKNQPDNLFQQSDWLELTGQQFGLANHFYVVTEGGKSAVISLQVRGQLAYSNFIGYGGPVAEVPLDLPWVDRLIAEISQQLSLTIKRIKFLPGEQLTGPVPSGWETINVAVWPLPTGGLAVKKSVRNSLVHAEKSGVVTRPLTATDLDRFYEIYRETMQRVGSDYETPQSLFRALLDFPRADLLGAFVDGRLEAASIFLNQGHSSYYWWNVATIHGRRLCANYLILFSEVKKLRANGVRVLDMASSHNLGIQNFKAQWGSELRSMYQYQRRI